MTDDERLNELAEAIADGSAIDWDEALDTADRDELRGIVERLRDLQRLALAVRALDEPPREWNGLVVGPKIGCGAFGAVYRAWDPVLQRDVALKLAPTPEAGFRHRALEEGRLLARVRHPSVVTVYSAEVTNGWAGLVMELVRGRTLEAIVADSGPLDPAQAAAVVRDLCSALEELHRTGILHRDVKPTNVMRESGGRVVLMDLGIGHRVGAAATRAGTRAYMAPELLEGRPPSVLSDVYSVGALLAFVLSGEHPPTSLDRSFPAPMGALIRRATSTDPAQRFSSVKGLVGALPPRSRSFVRWRLAAAAALLVLPAFLLWSARQRPTPAPSSNLPPIASAAPLPAPSPHASPAASGDPFVAPLGSRGHLGDSAPAASPTRAYTIAVRLGERLADGTRILTTRGSLPLSVYAVRETAPGACTLLVYGANPLAAGLEHELAVPEAKGRLLVIASPQPLAAFEREVARLRVPQPKDGVPLSTAALSELRALEPPGAGRGWSRPLFESAQPASANVEMAQGPWIRLLEP